MTTLNAILQPVHHVVAQVIEAELVVGAVGDIALVGGASLRCAGLARVEAADGQAQVLEDRAHPLRVAPRQVVVDGDQVGAATWERVQIER